MKSWFFSPNGQLRGPRARIYNYAREMIARGHEVTISTKRFFHAESREYLDETERTGLVEAGWNRLAPPALGGIADKRLRAFGWGC